MKRFVLYTYSSDSPVTSLLRRVFFLGVLLIVVVSLIVPSLAVANSTATARGYAGLNWAYAWASTHTHVPSGNCNDSDFKFGGVSVPCVSGRIPEYAFAKATAQPPWQTSTTVWAIGSEALLDVSARIERPVADAVTVVLTVTEFKPDEKLPLWAFLFLFQRPVPANEKEATDRKDNIILAGIELDLPGREIDPDNGDDPDEKKFRFKFKTNEKQLALWLEAGAGLKLPDELRSFLPVEPQHKLTTTWAKIKTEH